MTTLPDEGPVRVRAVNAAIDLDENARGRWVEGFVAGYNDRAKEEHRCAGERFVIQRQVGTRYVDWIDPLSGARDYLTHADALHAALRRGGTDMMIIRRTYSVTDEQVRL